MNNGSSEKCFENFWEKSALTLPLIPKVYVHSKESCCYQDTHDRAGHQHGVDCYIDLSVFDQSQRSIFWWIPEKA